MIRIVLIPLLGTLLGCGSVFIQGHFNSGSFSTVSGTVSIVHLTVVGTPSGTSVTVTFITLLETGFARDFTFCGNQTGFFPANASVQIQFIPGPNCATLTNVTRLPP